MKFKVFIFNTIIVFINLPLNSSQTNDFNKHKINLNLQNQNYKLEHRDYFLLIKNKSRRNKAILVNDDVSSKIKKRLCTLLNK